MLLVTLRIACSLRGRLLLHNLTNNEHLELFLHVYKIKLRRKTTAAAFFPVGHRDCLVELTLLGAVRRGPEACFKRLTGTEVRADCWK